MTGTDTDRVGLFSSCLLGWSAGRVIDVAVALAFATIEWGVGPEQAIERPDGGPELRQLCERAKLRVSGVSVQDSGATLAAPERIFPYLRVAVSLGTRYVRVFAPPYCGGSLGAEQRRVRTALDAVVEAAAPAGLIVLIETSPATLAPSPELAASLVEHHPPDRAGVLYDPGNTAIEGYVAPELAVARLGPYLHHVHVKNIGWAWRAGAWQWRHAALAQGMINWQQVLAALSATQYRGGFSIDHLGAKATGQLLRTETEHLRQLVSAAKAPPQDENDQRSKGASTSPTNI